MSIDRPGAAAGAGARGRGCAPACATAAGAACAVEGWGQRLGGRVVAGQ